MSDRYTEEDIDECREHTVRCAEHEYFFSFNSDELAEKFSDWWHIAGQKAFLEYANNSSYSLDDFLKDEMGDDAHLFTSDGKNKNDITHTNAIKEKRSK